MIRGIVNRHGEITAGTGFTVERIGVGHYRITADDWTQADDGFPVVTATAAAANRRATWDSITSTGVVVISTTDTDGTRIDQDFSFTLHATAS